MNSVPKLTIELVPETCWFSNVRSNVTEEEWNLLRRRTYRDAGYRCQICGGKGPEHPVECHEIWRYNDSTRVQTLDGLVALCPSCHQVKHFGLSNMKGLTDETLAHLSKVNGWDIACAKSYVDDQFKIWKERSQVDWALDVSWLEQFGIVIPALDRAFEPSPEMDVAYLPDMIDPEPQNIAARNYHSVYWWILGLAFIVAAIRAAYYLILQPNN